MYTAYYKFVGQKRPRNISTDSPINPIKFISIFYLPTRKSLDFWSEAEKIPVHLFVKYPFLLDKRESLSNPVS